MAMVGAKLKDLRRRRSLSVRELAARSGLSHSAISQIERDVVSPSVDTLGAILDALGTTLVGFFTDMGGQQFQSPFYEANELVEIGNVATVSYRVVGINQPDRQLLLLHERYVVGAHSGPAFSHAAQEAGLVTRGAIELNVNGQTRVLTQGDGYYFDSRLPHTFRNVSEEASEVVSAVTPPTY